MGNYCGSWIEVEGGVRCGVCGRKLPRKILRQCEGTTITSMTKPSSTTVIGPGTELKKLLAKFFIRQGGCDCEQRAMLMNLEGPDWCEQNIETIIDWLQEAAKKRHLPFLRPAAKILIRRAIKNSRKKLALVAKNTAEDNK
jgi:hypothetical protein